VAKGNVIQEQEPMFSTCRRSVFVFFSLGYIAVRYIDEIQCAAARVVKAMRQYAKSKNATNTNGDFDTFHIRRGDFQFRETRLSAEEIYNNVRDVLPDGSVVFIATDEQNKTFFEPLQQRYDVKFLNDFASDLNPPGFPKVNTNFYGMIDQLVVSIRVAWGVLGSQKLRYMLYRGHRQHEERAFLVCSSVLSPASLSDYEVITRSAGICQDRSGESYQILFISPRFDISM
jgi:GDP-fucose protein O-fucosyltransferase